MKPNDPNIQHRQSTHNRLLTTDNKLLNPCLRGEIFFYNKDKCPEYPISFTEGGLGFFRFHIETGKKYPEDPVNPV